MASSEPRKLSVSHPENIMGAKAQVNCYLLSLKLLSVDFFILSHGGGSNAHNSKKEVEMVFVIICKNLSKFTNHHRDLF